MIFGEPRISHWLRKHIYSYLTLKEVIGNISQLSHFERYKCLPQSELARVGKVLELKKWFERWEGCLVCAGKLAAE